MSGFVFILNQNGEIVNEHLMHKLVGSLHGKGPDRQRIYIDNNIGLGHTLFKTTFEAEYDRQPVSLDGQVWIVSHARIDGREELVKKLGLSKLIDISKIDDSELILYAYRNWGEKCTEHLIGDFAFVIWDGRKKNVFCAKDQLGMKELYYAQKDNFLIVSNSLNTMTMHPRITKELNKKSMGGFLLFGNQAWLDKSITVFKDIKKLLPAHNLIYNAEKKIFKIEKYWLPSVNVKILKYSKESDYLDHFNELFELAVKDRIRNSSITISMSGGMDSTSIAAAVANIKEKSLYTLTPQAVTAVYDEIDSSQERHYAQVVSEKLNIPIHYFSGDKYKMLNPYIATTEPIQMHAPAYILDFRKIILNYSRAYLTGDSADNLLSFTPPFYSEKKIDLGRFFYQMLKMRFIYGQFPSMGLGIKSKYRKNVVSYNGYPTWLNPEFENSENLKDEWNTFKMKQVLKKHPINPNSLNSITLAEWSTDDYLMSPTEILPEARDPFLDIRLIDFILSIPSLPWLYKKHILRRSMTDRLPKSVIKRPKTPLGRITTNLMRKRENKWVENWKPSEMIEEFIALDKFKSISQVGNNKNFDLELRALYLETWLSHLD